MTVKLQKWPPSVNGVFPADAKRSLQLQLEPTHPSLDECTEEIKKAYGSMLSIKIYFYDGFKVMPAVREEYFTFCMKRFKMNYANFVNHIDMNRLYIVANPTKRVVNQKNYLLHAQSQGGSFQMSLAKMILTSLRG